MLSRLKVCSVMYALIVWGLLLPHVALAQGPVILAVEAEGLFRVDKDAALAGTQLTKGKLFDADLATADLRLVWQTGFFKDVRLEQEKKANGVVLIYRLQEKPFIKSVSYLGLEALSEDDVKAVVNLKPLTILNTELINKNVEKIKDLYVGKGYYLASVDFKLIEVESQQEQNLGSEVEVLFDIHENAKVMVRQIALIGNQHIADDLIYASMQTRVGHELSWLMQSGTYKEEFFQTDILRIQALYYDHGFITVKIGEPIATLSKDRRFIDLSLYIEEGPQYSLGNIAFSGDVLLQDANHTNLVDETSLSDVLQVRSGDLFNRTNLFNDVQVLTDIYRDQGFAFANITPNTALHPQERTVDIDFEVERGEVVFFEHIEIRGNVRTRDKVIRRELRIYEGERYSNADLNVSRARIYQLGYFESVNLTTSRGSTPDKLNVTVEVKEKSTGTFQIGAGFSSIESFIANAQISQNNFLGNGQSLAMSMQLSFGTFARQLATFQFADPYFLDSPWSMGLNAYLTQRYYRDFQRNALGASPSFGYPLSDNVRVNMGYTLENVDIAIKGGEYAPVLYGLSRAGVVSSVHSSVSFDTRDNRLLPQRGMFDELRAEISSTALGANSAMSFKRLELDMRYYHPLFWSMVFRVNTSLGWVFGADGGVPISERYFPGGIYSVRGYPPRGLGPSIRVPYRSDDPGAATRDFFIGGNKQAVINIEIEFPIIPQAGVKGVVFTDAGNAFNDDQGWFYLDMPLSIKSPGYMMGSLRHVIPPLGLYHSFGFGVRWQSPIGPLRFEWGIPIIKREPDDQPLVFEFTIGNFF